MKINLVAKPWKGGLGRYFYLALQEMFPSNVRWISTRPEGFSENLLYRRDPAMWWHNLRAKISEEPYDATLFLGDREAWRMLKFDDRHIFYGVDAVRNKPGDFDAFGRIYISDPGYVKDLLPLIKASRFHGILPFAFHPKIHRPRPSHKPIRDLCFIGNRDKKRDVFLGRLLGEDFSSLIVGNYFLKAPLFWQRPTAFRPSVTNDTMGFIYANHKLALNVHASVVREGTNMRTFECAGYGIAQIVERRPALEDYFKPDEEIKCFDTALQMIAQTKELLADSCQRQALAQRARSRALAEHTYHHRIARVFESLIPKTVLSQGLANMSKIYASH